MLSNPARRIVGSTLDKMNNKLHIKKGDTVVLNVGSYSNKFTKPGEVKTGTVLEVSPKEGKVIVEGINMVSKHVKPRKQGETGGIVKAEAPINACKVSIYCPVCKKGVRTKVKIEDGKKIRVCAKCGKEL